MKIVCFSEIQWRYVRTRKQQILTRLPGDREILFLSSVVKGKRNNFRPERDGRVVHVCVPALKNFPQKWLRALFSIPPARFVYNCFLFLWLSVILRMTGFHTKDRVFYVSNIYYARILPLLGRKLLLYDCNDDPMSFPNAPAWAGKYFRRLVRSADIIVSVSRGLVELLERSGARDVRHIGNGVDFDLFVGAARAGVPDEMKEFTGSILGYCGAIAPWFDLELLRMVAVAFPDASIVLLGPVFNELKGPIEEIERETGNVHYLGVKPYETLGSYVASMDVCLIPLEQNELMRLADPNKLYEYASVGKPIVTMLFSEEMEEFGDFIYLARTREEFVEKVQTALSERADSEKLVAFARRRSWQARSEEMAALIDDWPDRQRDR